MSELPAVLPGGNGEKPARDSHGRFVAGAPPGPGRPANPFARYQAELRGALLVEVQPADLCAVMRQVLRLAKRGHLPAVELLLKWTLGAPPTPVDPDRLDEHELDVRRKQPTLLDQLTLAVDQAEDPDGKRVRADEADDPDLPPPPLQAMLSWALRELSATQLRSAATPPPNPTASWETFARDRLEWEASAAVEVEALYLAYTRWCASHGEVALEEAPVVAALQTHGASVRTGALSQTTLVVGVRVMA